MLCTVISEESHQGQSAYQKLLTFQMFPFKIVKHAFLKNHKPALGNSPKPGEPYLFEEHHTQSMMCICVRVYIYTRISVCTYMCIHTYTDTHIPYISLKTAQT